MAYGGYHRLRVLVVDDFDSFRMTISRFLQDFGVSQVDTVGNGQEAIRLCASKGYDLILCDYNLGPGKNGQQVLEELRQREIIGIGCLFALVSAESSKNIVLAAYDSGPDAYLTKPITAKALQQRLDRLLAERDEMLPICQLLGEGDTEGAIAACEERIAKNSRYASSCQKRLSQLYLDTQQYDKAEQLYQQVLQVRPLDWAQLGLAKVKQATGDLNRAGEWLSDIIQNNPMCMPAYDALAENCRLQNNDQKLQQVLQDAGEMSPMALLRQQSLAQTAAENNDLIVAATAYKRAVRLGQNSCYDNVDTHLNFARTTAALFKESPSDVKDLARDALRALDMLPKNFVVDKERGFQSQLVQAQIYAFQGDSSRSSTQLQEVETQLKEEGFTLGLDASIDLFQALEATGEGSRSKLLLDDLIEKYKDNQDAMNKIDRLLDEPVSDANRKQVAQINKQGIRLYENKNFAEAITLFQKARCLFPNHIGVQLNMVQAQLGEMREYGAEVDCMETCLSIMARIGSNISPNHSQARRHRQLYELLRNVERESKANG